MKLTVLPNSQVYIVYKWDGYNSEWAVSAVFANRKKAEKYRKEENDYIKETDGREIFNEDGSVNFDNTDSEDRYYDIITANLTL